MVPRGAVGFPGQGGDWGAAVRTLSDAGGHSLAAELATRLGTEDWTALEPLDTRITQPVVFVAGLVGAERAGLRPDSPSIVAAIGHSLGEITACCFAGAIEPIHGLGLVAERSELGHRGHAERPGAMVAIMRLDRREVEWVRRVALAEAGGVLDTAVVNSDMQVVLSGDAATAEVAARRAEQAGGVARPLPIGGAYHSTLMVDAVAPFRQRVEQAVRGHLTVPVVLSTTGAAVTEAADLPGALARALVLPVDWPGAVAALASLGVNQAVDAGPGDTLVRLARFAEAVDFVPPRPVPQAQ